MGAKETETWAGGKFYAKEISHSLHVAKSSSSKLKVVSAMMAAETFRL